MLLILIKDLKMKHLKNKDIPRKTGLLGNMSLRPLLNLGGELWQCTHWWLQLLSASHSQSAHFCLLYCLEKCHVPKCFVSVTSQSVRGHPRGLSALVDLKVKKTDGCCIHTSVLHLPHTTFLWRPEQKEAAVARTCVFCTHCCCCVLQLVLRWKSSGCACTGILEVFLFLFENFMHVNTWTLYTPSPISNSLRPLPQHPLTTSCPLQRLS